LQAIVRELKDSDNLPQPLKKWSGKKEPSLSPSHLIYMHKKAHQNCLLEWRVFFTQESITAAPYSIPHTIITLFNMKNGDALLLLSEPTSYNLLFHIYFVVIHISTRESFCLCIALRYR
jgi:hypothetical protein